MHRIFHANEEGSQESEQRLAHLFTGAQVPRSYVLRVLAGSEDAEGKLVRSDAKRLAWANRLALNGEPGGSEAP
jgi:hypothetical protein